VRRALVASTREGELVFDPFCGSGTSGVAAKELGCFFVGAELEEEFCPLGTSVNKGKKRGRRLLAEGVPGPRDEPSPFGISDLVLDEDGGQAGPDDPRLAAVGHIPRHVEGVLTGVDGEHPRDAERVLVPA
jgi:hypothetical protein